MNNDLITNIKKYSKILFNVVWTKIEKYIPFKDEFMQLYAEFRSAWQNFLKTKQVVYVTEKVRVKLNLIGLSCVRVKCELNAPYVRVVLCIFVNMESRLCQQYLITVSVTFAKFYQVFLIRTNIATLWLHNQLFSKNNH